MARMNKEQVIGMLFDADFDSGGESEIDEDMSFPFPMQDEDDEYTPSLQCSPRESLVASPALTEWDTTSEESGSEIEQESVSRRGRVRGRGRGRGRGRARGRGRGSTQRNRQRSPHARGMKHFCILYVYTNKTIPHNSECK